MYKDKSICVVVPAYNEATQIGKVIETMPDYVDRIVIIDDVSIDETIKAVKQYQQDNDRIVLIEHELTALLNPVVEGKADYSKGNRLFTGEAYKKIPKIRYFGNAFLSLLTKIASGYWNVADSQSGYTVINKHALNTIDWNSMYKRYGQPNDLLIRLNIFNFRVTDVPVEPVYNIGESSGIKIRKVVFTICWMLMKMFLWRMKEKYVIRDFHPLIFFYALGGLFSLSTLLLFARIIYYKFSMGIFPPTSSLAAMFSFMSASLFTLFAMWFDMEANKDLK